MGKAEDLRDALKAAEQAVGHVVERYRSALGCCMGCGDFFQPGDLAVAMVDEAGAIAFEHDECPEETTNYRETYRNGQQQDEFRAS